MGPKWRICGTICWQHWHQHHSMDRFAAVSTHWKHMGAVKTAKAAIGSRSLALALALAVAKRTYFSEHWLAGWVIYTQFGYKTQQHKYIGNEGYDSFVWWRVFCTHFFLFDFLVYRRCCIMRLNYLLPYRIVVVPTASSVNATNIVLPIYFVFNWDKIHSILCYGGSLWVKNVGQCWTMLDTSICFDFSD